MILAREMLRRNRVEWHAAACAVRIVEVLHVQHTIPGHKCRGALEMVTQHVEDAVVAAVAAPPQPASLVVAGVRCALPLVDTGDIDGRGSTDSSLDPVAVSVVQEGRQGRRILLHFGQAVFVVEDEGVGHAADGPAGLVAIAVVGVGVAVGACHNMLVGAVTL